LAVKPTTAEWISGEGEKNSGGGKFKRQGPSPTLGDVKTGGEELGNQAGRLGKPNSVRGNTETSWGERMRGRRRKKNGKS